MSTSAATGITEQPPASTCSAAWTQNGPTTTVQYTAADLPNTILPSTQTDVNG